MEQEYVHTTYGIVRRLTLPFMRKVLTVLNNDILNVLIVMIFELDVEISRFLFIHRQKMVLCLEVIGDDMPRVRKLKEKNIKKNKIYSNIIYGKF
jgi:hypothetical protein